MNEIMTLISNVGFPIAICIMLMYYVLTLTKEHKAETKEFTEALNKNTLVLQSLADKLNEVIK